MEIKEQVAKEIFEYDFTGFNPKWAECANKSHWLNLANKIIELFEQSKDPDEGLEVRPEIIERLEKSKQIPKEELLTSEQMREKLGIEQSLMLSDEEIRNILQTGGTPMDFSRAIAEAELRHLEELGIMYVKVIQERSVADGAGFKRMRKTIIYIPLSEYRKENEK